MMTCVQPASTSIAAEMSPVCAPSLSQCISWADTATFDPSAASAAAANAVKGGATTTSQCTACAATGLIISMKCTASATVLYIFQFPAITGLRMFSILGQK